MARDQVKDLNGRDPISFAVQLGTKLDQLLQYLLGDRLVAGVPGLARGSTPTSIATGLVYYRVANALLTKAAVAAGTALPAGTIPADKWGSYLVSLNALGTVAVTGAALNTTGYANEGAALVAVPETPAGSVKLGHFTVKTAAGQSFVPNTNALEGGGGTNPSSDTNYYDNTDLPVGIKVADVVPLVKL